MRILRSCVFSLLVLILIPAAAHADDHRADWYVAFSGGTGASSLYGFHNAFAIAINTPTLHRLSIVPGDVSVQFGSHDGEAARQATYLAGARLTVSKHGSHVKPTVHALAGTVIAYRGAVNSTSGAISVGGGLEYVRDDPARVQATIVGARMQVDYIMRTDDQDNFWRVSGGLVLRLK